MAVLCRAGVVAIGVFLAIITETHGLGPRCYSCAGVSNLIDCTKIEQCSSHEQCQVWKYRESSGATKFDLGCAPEAQCAFIQGHNKREVTGSDERSLQDRAIFRRADPLLLCAECCNDDYCNVHGCQVVTTVKDPKRCLNCDKISEPADCFSVALCGQDESCRVFENLDFYGRPVFQMGCEAKEFCDLIPSSGAMGKRYNFCQKCCDGDHCNARICSPRYNSTNHVPLQIVMEPGDVIYNGSTATADFVCKGVGGQVTYSWFHEDASGTRTKVASTINSKQESQISISSPMKADEGKYICVVSNGERTMNLFAFLNVTQRNIKPKITSLTHDQTVTLGSKVTLTCDASGTPPPTFHWGHIDMFHFPESVAQMPGISTSGNTLTIQSVEHEHAGTYMCRATNSAGSDSAQVVVNVQ